MIFYAIKCFGWDYIGRARGFTGRFRFCVKEKFCWKWVFQSHQTMSLSEWLRQRASSSDIWSGSRVRRSVKVDTVRKSSASSEYSLLSSSDSSNSEDSVNSELSSDSSSSSDLKRRRAATSSTSTFLIGVSTFELWSASSSEGKV